MLLKTEEQTCLPPDDIERANFTLTLNCLSKLFINKTAKVSAFILSTCTALIEA